MAMLRQLTLRRESAIRIGIDPQVAAAEGFRAMTFDEAIKIIKRGDIVHLRKELEEGLSPSLCNQHSWTLLMIAAMEGNTSIGRLLIEKGADLTNGTITARHPSP